MFFPEPALDESEFAAENYEEQNLITQVVEQMKKKGISSRPQDYQLDIPLQEQEINTKLKFFSSQTLNQSPEPLLSDFQNTSTNYVSFLSWCLQNERNVIYEHYWNEGFLGRALLFLIDKIITACECSFQLMRARDSQDDSELIFETSQQEIASADLRQIERTKEIKALKKLIEDTRTVKQELLKLEQFLDGADENSSDLISRVKSLMV